VRSLLGKSNQSKSFLIQKFGGAPTEFFFNAEIRFRCGTVFPWGSQSQFFCGPEEKSFGHATVFPWGRKPNSPGKYLPFASLG
jgi:hypothetical protein